MQLLNQEGVRGVIRLFAKKWAYVCGTILTVFIFIVLFISFFVPWFSNHMTGNFWIPPQSYPLNSTEFFPTEYVTENFYMHEYLFHVEWTEFQGLSVNCKYTEGAGCSDLDTLQYYFPNVASWDLKQLAPNYGAIFAFLILDIIVAIILGIYLQVMVWKSEEWSIKIRKILTGVAIGITLVLFGLLLITWTIIMGHQKMIQDSMGPSGYDQDWCDRLLYRRQGGPICNWLAKNYAEDWTDVTGEVHVQKQTNWFLGCQVSQFEEWSYPDGGWICTTLALGFSLWILILVVGWHPSFES